MVLPYDAVGATDVLYLVLCSTIGGLLMVLLMVLMMVVLLMMPLLVVRHVDIGVR